MTIQDWCLVAIFLIIMISGVVGNLLVIYVFGNKKDKRSTEFLIFYLGIIDLMTSIFNPPLNIYWILTHFEKWHFGALGCKILPAIGPTMTTASGWVLLIFAVERYCAIVTPFSSRFSPMSIKIACLASVLGSAAMYVHYINSLQMQYGMCYVPDVKVPEYGYPNCIFIIIRLLAFILIFSSTNIQIYRTLRKNELSFSAKELRETRTRQSKRIMRILNVMGIVFVVLVFPRELLYLIYNMSDLIHQDSGGVYFGLWVVQLNSWLKVMHTSNSCANIFIYANMQDTYKRQIRKILEWGGCYTYRFKRTSFQRSGLKKHMPSNNNRIKCPQTTTSDVNNTFCSNSSYYRRRDSTKKDSTTATAIVFFKRAQHFQNARKDDFEERQPLYQGVKL